MKIHSITKNKCWKANLTDANELKIRKKKHRIYFQFGFCLVFVNRLTRIELTNSFNLKSVHIQNGHLFKVALYIDNLLGGIHWKFNIDPSLQSIRYVCIKHLYSFSLPINLVICFPYSLTYARTIYSQ